MIRIVLEGPRNEKGQEPIFSTSVPALPRVGDFIDHEPSGIRGDVKSVGFWWNEAGKLTVSVKVR